MKKTAISYIFRVLLGMVLVMSQSCVDDILDNTIASSTSGDSITVKSNPETVAIATPEVTFNFNPGFNGRDVGGKNFVFTFYVNYKSTSEEYITPKGAAYFSNGDSYEVLTPEIFAGMEHGICPQETGNAWLITGPKNFSRWDTIYAYGPGGVKSPYGIEFKTDIRVEVSVNGGATKTREYHFESPLYLF